MALKDKLMTLEDFKAVRDVDVASNQTQFTAIKADLGAVEESALPKPTTSPAGTNGQLLRSKGNGQTEWADFGTPTDAQVGNAVDTWLADHPEATTTVQDESLTYNKLAKGAVGFVTPQNFGAVGDGLNDDTQAVQSAVTYAKNNGLSLTFPKGTYLITGVDIPHGSKLYGKGAIIKRPNLKESPYSWSDTEIKWASPFVIQKTSAERLLTIIDGFEFDGNCWSMWQLSDGFKYEQATFIACTGNASYGMNDILVTNCYFHDNFSSGVSIRSNVSCTIENCKSYECFKGLFTAVGQPMRLSVSDCEILADTMDIGFDVEINFPDNIAEAAKTYVYVKNVYSECAVTCGGGANGSVHIYEGIKAVYKNTNSKLGGSAYYSTTVFKGCKFTVDGQIMPPYFTAGSNTYLKFEDCIFDSINGPAMALIRPAGTSFGNNAQIQFTRCIFSNAVYAYNAGAMQNTKLSFDKCTFENTLTSGAIGNASGSSFVPDYIDISNCEFFNQGYVLHTGYVSGNAFYPKIRMSSNKYYVSNSGIVVRGAGTTINVNNEMIYCNGIPIEQDESSGKYFLSGNRKIVTWDNPAQTVISGKDDIDTMFYFYPNTNGKYVHIKYIRTGENWIPVESDDRSAAILPGFASVDDIWDNIELSLASANKASPQKNIRIKTKNYIPDDVSTVSANTGYQFLIMAFDAGSYVGVWKNASIGFQKSETNSPWKTTEDISAIRTAYPDYKYIIQASKSDKTKKISVKEASNIIIQ